MRGSVAVKINDLYFCVYWSKFSEDYTVGKQASVCNSYKRSLESLCVDYIYVCLCSY